MIQGSVTRFGYPRRVQELRHAPRAVLKNSENLTLRKWMCDLEGRAR